MKLRQFLDAGYALLLEEYTRVGVPLQSALEHMRDWAAGPARTPEDLEKKEKEAIARQNEQAIDQLKGMIGAV